MAFVIVRELITRLGYKIQSSGLKKYQGQLGTLSGKLRSVAAGMGKFALGVAKVAAAALAAAAAIGAIGLGIAAREFFKTSLTVDKLNARLRTLTGSSQAASAKFKELQGLASKMPFDLEQATSAFIKLKTFGLDATEKALISYGNTAAATTGDLNQLVEAVADATRGEFERINEFGIKAKKQGDIISFTFNGITTKVKNNAKDIEKFLQGIGNTTFAGAMAEQMKTLGGAISNLRDSIFVFFKEMGDGPDGARAALATLIRTIGDAIGGASGLAKSIGGVLAKAIRVVTSLFTRTVEVVKSSGPLLDTYWRLFVLGTKAARKVLVDVVLKGFALVASAIQRITRFYAENRVMAERLAVSVGSVWSKVLSVLSRFFDFLGSEDGSKFFDEIFVGLEKYLKLISRGLDELPSLFGVVSKAWDTLAKGLDKLRPEFSALVDEVKGLIGDLGEGEDSFDWSDVLSVTLTAVTFLVASTRRLLLVLRAITVSVKNWLKVWRKWQGIVAAAIVQVLGLLLVLQASVTSAFAEAGAAVDRFISKIEKALTLVNSVTGGSFGVGSLSLAGAAASAGGTPKGGEVGGASNVTSNATLGTQVLNFFNAGDASPDKVASAARAGTGSGLKDHLKDIRDNLAGAIT